MAEAKTYSVYDKWYKILSWLAERVDNFPKKVKSTFSDRILNNSYGIVEKIIEALYRREKTDILKDINIDIEKIRVFMSNRL